MVNKILNKNKKSPTISQAAKKPSVNDNSRTKSCSLTNLPLKKVSKKCGEREQNVPLNTIQNYSEGSCKQSDVLNSVISGSKCSNEVNLDSPRMCSALRLANEIKSAEAKTIPHIKLCDLQKEIKPKVVKKTNVPFSEHIFHDLVDLEINDEVIVSGKKTSSKLHEFVRSKDKVFHLEDYYKPNFSKEICPKVPFQKKEIEKVQHYDGFDIYDRINSLPVCQ